MSNPKVSILIPNFNHEKFLNQRIDSILNQTFQDFEIILMDDKSSDNSLEILNSYISNPKVSEALYNEINSGSPFGMWEEGINKAKGKYIWIAESDDWSENNFLESVIDKMDKSDVVLTHSQSYFVYGANKKINYWWDSFSTSLWKDDFVMNGSNLLDYYGKYKCPVINVSSAIFKKSVIKNITFPSDYRYCGDWWFWAQLFNLGNVAFVAKPLNNMRIHVNSATSPNDLNNYKRLIENIKVVNNISILLKQKLKYNENYKWIIDLWVSLTANNKNYININYYNLDLPISFKIVFLKELFFKLKTRALKKIKI